MGFLMNPATLAFLLTLAGVLMLVGAWQGIGLKEPGPGRPVAFAAGGIATLLGLYGLFGALSGGVGSQAIQIDAVVYGAPQFSPPEVPPFPTNTIDCTHYARPLCDGQPTCSLRFSNQACGGDPNQGSLKVAEIIYRCGGEPLHTFALESRATTLGCR
jgi:hypothetical protein